MNRVLADFETRNLIKIGRRRIQISDRERLRKEIRY